jgi:putative ABC transport system permease protein
MYVDENFLSTYSIRLIAGRNFIRGTDIPSVMMNEAALSTLKFESPKEALNHRIHWQGKEFELIGVFSNYNHLFLRETFEPVMLTYRPASAGFITMKISDGFSDEALAVASKELQSLFPGSPFEYTFLETTYNYQYRSISQFESLTQYFALLAILISCFGLFSLSYYSVQRRIREMAVRKILGASIMDIVLLLARGYISIAFASCMLGSLFTWYAMHKWLQHFAFTIHLDARDFLAPMIAITFVVMATISYSCLKTSFINPSATLKQS